MEPRELSRRRDQSGPKRRIRWSRVGLLLASIIVLVVSVAAGYAYITEPIFKESKLMPDLLGPSKVNILLLGINERQNDRGRSNVTCLLTLDTKNKTAHLLSIPRDSRVKIAGHDWNKIGHAYAYGGPELAKQTVAELVGVPIDYYLGINMAGFIKAIDIIGGVDMQVEKRMYYYDPYDEGEVDNNGLIDLRPGWQHLDGNRALQYVRFRHDEMGDIGRIERQQKFLRALLEELASAQTLPKVPQLIGALREVVITDIPLTKLVAWGGLVSAVAQRGLENDTVEGRPVYINQVSYWLPDIASMHRLVNRIQDHEPNRDEQVKVEKQQIEYKNALRGLKVIDAP